MQRLAKGRNGTDGSAQGAGVPDLAVRSLRKPAVQGPVVPETLRQFAKRARGLALYHCENCRTLGPITLGGSIAPLTVLTILPLEKCSGWHDRLNPTINSLTICDYCLRDPSPYKPHVQDKVKRAVRAFEAWKTFDRVPDHRDLPGCPK